MKRFILTIMLIALAAPALARDTQDASTPTATIKSCLDDPGYHQLDFLLGTWNVQVQGVVVGQSKVRRILRGCAVEEQYESRRGDLGRSLFTYDRVNEKWEQIWVTDGAFSPGGLTKKTLADRLEGGGMLFEGEVLLPNEGSYLERTTLRPLNNGTVHQLVEISNDGGFEWTATFDAVYVRATS